MEHRREESAMKRNRDVVTAWKEGKDAKSRHLTSRRGMLMSYGLLIGVNTGRETIAYDFTGGGGEFVSMTTSHHVGMARSVASKIESPRESPVAIAKEVSVALKKACHKEGCAEPPETCPLWCGGGCSEELWIDTAIMWAAANEAAKVHDAEQLDVARVRKALGALRVAQGCVGYSDRVRALEGAINRAVLALEMLSGAVRSWEEMNVVGRVSVPRVRVIEVDSGLWDLVKGSLEISCDRVGKRLMWLVIEDIRRAVELGRDSEWGPGVLESIDLALGAIDTARYSLRHVYAAGDLELALWSIREGLVILWKDVARGCGQYWT